MCQIHNANESSQDGAANTSKNDQIDEHLEADPASFPWHLGVYDSHCHPTDSMHVISSLSTMNAHCLTIMATRFQDQDLVKKVASEYACDPSSSHSGTRVIPSFGYHPWFSHLIYDDLSLADKDRLDKEAHYNNVLTSSPVDPELASSLPEPTPLSQILTQTRTNLLAHPSALLGEVGLDRTFRIPHGTTWRSSESGSDSATINRTANLTPGTHHSHPLTKHRVNPSHQKQILQAQLRLAGSLNRAASVHVVGGQGTAFAAMEELWKGYEKHVPNARERKIAYRKPGDPIVEIEQQETNKTEEGEENRPFPSRICLHSFSGPPETVKQYLHPAIPVDFYFSFSEAINFSLPEHQQKSSHDRGGQGESDPASARALAALKIVPDDRLLIESDLHICGERMDGLLEGIIRRVCAARGWTLEEGVIRLGRNWRRFVFGREDVEL